MAGNVTDEIRTAARDVIYEWRNLGLALRHSPVNAVVHTAVAVAIKWEVFKKVESLFWSMGIEQEVGDCLHDERGEARL